MATKTRTPATTAAAVDAAATTPAATVTCILCQPHTHQGRDLPPGSQIDLPLAQAKWLHSLGVIDAPATPTDPSADPVKE